MIIFGSALVAVLAASLVTSDAEDFSMFKGNQLLPADKFLRGPNQYNRLWKSHLLISQGELARLIVLPANQAEYSLALSCQDSDGRVRDDCSLTLVIAREHLFPLSQKNSAPSAESDSLTSKQKISLPKELALLLSDAWRKCIKLRSPLHREVLRDERTPITYFSVGEESDASWAEFPPAPTEEVQLLLDIGMDLVGCFSFEGEERKAMEEKIEKKVKKLLRRLDGQHLERAFQGGSPGVASYIVDIGFGGDLR